jgi:hypothetical protein
MEHARAHPRRARPEPVHSAERLGAAACAFGQARARAGHRCHGRPGDRPRREERRKTEVHTAAPPRRGGIDPDSPFAALGALRDELAKRGKESST